MLAGARSVRGTLSMSGLGSSLDVTSRVSGGGRKSSVKIAARGPWGVASGTKRHRIEPTGRRRAVLTPKGPRASVTHPGTRKVDLWGKSTAKAEPKIGKAVDAAAEDAVGDVLGLR